MKGPLHIGAELALPLDAATQTFAFIARKGAGKTYAAGKLVEELLTAEVQVVILDTVGNWYGLRLAGDGRGKGFDVPVLGGLRGDIPLEATGGALIADIVVESGRSLIVDVSQFSLADRKRFATAFGEQLWKGKKGESRPSPLHLVIEESQLIVPQFSKGEDATMLGIFEEIIRLGRNYGIGVSMISQRPQSVNKEVLNQTECLFVGQVNGAQERDALKKWIVHQGMNVGLVDELPGLPIGTFYVWSPQWLNILQKVRIGKKSTFDSTATPKVGDRTERRELKPLDLDDLKTKMSATIERAKKENPRELQKKIMQLERELKAKPAAAPAANHQAAAKARDEIRNRDLIIRDLRGRLDRVGKTFARTLKIHEEITNMLLIVDDPTPAATWKPDANEKKRVIDAFDDAAKSLARKRNAVPSSSARTLEYARGESDLAGPDQRILTELAELEILGISPVEKSQLALVSGYTNPRSGGFSEPLGRLVAGGLIRYPQPGKVAITDDGRAIAQPGTVPMTTDELQGRLLSKLDGPRGKILRALIEIYPDSIEKQTLGEQTGYTNTRSGGFSEPLGSLRRLGLIDYPEKNHVIATPVLFIEGRP